jgi:thiol-disulfide isomerase/thioredoxin
MIRLFSIVLLWLSTQPSFAQSYAVVSGQLRNRISDDIYIKCYGYDPINKEDIEVNANVASDGSFKAYVPVVVPCLARLYNNLTDKGDFIALFLRPGDSLYITQADPHDFDSLDLVFEAKGAENNRYMAYYKKNLWPRPMKDFEWPPAMDYLKASLPKLNTLIMSFDSLAKLFNISYDFYQFERYRTIYRWSNSLMLYPMQRKAAQKVNTEMNLLPDSVPFAYYQQVVDAVPFNNDSACIARDYLNTMRYYRYHKSEHQQIAHQDNPTYRAATERLILDTYTNKTQELMYIIWLCESISEKNIDSVPHYLQRFKARFRNSPYIGDYQRQENQIFKFAKGKNIPPFTFQDSLGRNYTLADFKGKIIYLGIWASRCGPCHYEMKLAQALNDSIFADTNLVRMYISIDEKPENWRKTLTLGNYYSLGKHFIASGGNKSAVCTAFESSAVPQYKIIDRDGKIWTNQAPRPGNSSSLVSQLKTALKEK